MALKDALRDKGRRESCRPAYIEGKMSDGLWYLRFRHTHGSRLGKIHTEDFGLSGGITVDTLGTFERRWTPALALDGTIPSRDRGCTGY